MLSFSPCSQFPWSAQLEEVVWGSRKLKNCRGLPAKTPLQMHLYQSCQMYIGAPQWSAQWNLVLHSKINLKLGEKLKLIFSQENLIPYLETILFQNSWARKGWNYLQTESTCSTDKTSKHKTQYLSLKKTCSVEFSAVWDH